MKHEDTQVEIIPPSTSIQTSSSFLPASTIIQHPPDHKAVLAQRSPEAATMVELRRIDADHKAKLHRDHTDLAITALHMGFKKFHVRTIPAHTVRTGLFGWKRVYVDTQTVFEGE